jgi:hypothetical protein
MNGVFQALGRVLSSGAANLPSLRFFAAPGRIHSNWPSLRPVDDFVEAFAVLLRLEELFPKFGFSVPTMVWFASCRRVARRRIKTRLAPLHRTRLDELLERAYDRRSRRPS